jgi:hypothetical protein
MQFFHLAGSQHRGSTTVQIKLPTGEWDPHDTQRPFPIVQVMKDFAHSYNSNSRFLIFPY